MAGQLSCLTAPLSRIYFYLPLSSHHLPTYLIPQSLTVFIDYFLYTLLDPQLHEGGYLSLF